MAASYCYLYSYVPISLLLHNPEPLGEGNAEETVEVPIIMYHSILKDSSKSGKYVITPKQFEEDLLYLKEKGYTTITMTDLIEYVHHNVDLPEKPVILTLDDGYYNNITYVVPLLKKHNMKAVISIVGTYTDRFSEANEANANYGHIRWCDIADALPEGVVEFQNHSYNLHSIAKGRKGSAKKSGESLEAYTKLLKEDVMKLQDKFQTICFYTPNTFTYPYGTISKVSKDILKELGFKATLSCKEGINQISKDPDCLYSLRRFNRPSGRSSEKYFKKILDK